MIVYRSIGDIKKKITQAHIALGVFDGLHRGHVRVIQEAMKSARRDHGQVGVYTFPNHPMKIIDPVNCPALLFTPGQKEELLREMALDFLVMESFSESLRVLSPEDFLDRLRTNLDLRTVSVGDDFRFGHGRTGGVEFLKERGRSQGFGVIAVPIERHQGTVISSGLIRFVCSV